LARPAARKQLLGRVILVGERGNQKCEREHHGFPRLITEYFPDNAQRDTRGLRVTSVRAARRDSGRKSTQDMWAGARALRCRHKDDIIQTKGGPLVATRLGICY
jgi:hypothetical protein